MGYTIVGIFYSVKASKSTTKDGRAAYKTVGGTKTQPVYMRDKGQYVRGPDGKLIVIGYRVKRYGWTSVAGKLQKTEAVSMFVDTHPNDMSRAESSALDRDLSELLKHTIATVDVVRNATDDLRQAMESGDSVESAQFGKVTSKVLKLLEKRNPGGAAAQAAIIEFLTVAKQVSALASTEADQLAQDVEREETFLATSASTLASAHRLTSLGTACFRYILDSDHGVQGTTPGRFMSATCVITFLFRRQKEVKRLAT